MKTAIVLGAGMVGVSTALALRDHGWDVTLVDRRAPGQETSYGNAGIIQSEAVEPHGMPRSLRELFTIARGATNDVRYSLRELPFHLRSLALYWWHSEGLRHRSLSAVWASLIAQATSTHAGLIERAGADNLIRRAGFREFYRDRAQLDRAVANAERLAATYGIEFRALSGAETAAAEPALSDTGAGTLHWLGPWTASDPGGLVASYAALFQHLGGRFLSGDAKTLKRDGSGWSVKTDSGEVKAEHAVLALGPWSPELLKRFGHSFPMVRKRGYHMHYKALRPLNAPLLDTDNGFVLAPMAAGMRITTGAHLARIGSPVDHAQLDRSEAAARKLIDLGPRVEDRTWHGTRPCMPDMLPVIGASAANKGLWMNFGHGHQGFTLGPATGGLLAAVMSGQRSATDIAPFRPERY